MASGLNDITLAASGSATVKLPKAFGSSDAIGTVVEVQTNNPLGEESFYLELFNKKGSAGRITKKTAKNFLKYIKNDVYEGSIFHRSVPGFVLQGGGFSAPEVPTSEGGQIGGLEDFGTVANQPGNSNLRGTVAMAKLGGQPDSATNQWFVNLEDNISLDTQNSGFTVFGRVLGEGMAVVDQLSSTEVYNFGGVLSQLPLWDLRLTDDGVANLYPEDFLVVEATRKLPSKKQPFTLTVESSDESLLTATVTKKQRIKLQAAPGARGEAEVSVRSVSSVDGSIQEDSFDVLIGSGPSSRRGEASARRKPIDVLVSGGSLEQPFYRFFDSEGEELDGLEINVKKTYRFHRLGNAGSHPFYLSDSGLNQPSSRSLKLKGDGNFDEGIIGDESFSLRIKKKHRADFKQNGQLSYFCTSHPTMNGLFSIKGQPQQTSEGTEAFESGSDLILPL